MVLIAGYFKRMLRKIGPDYSVAIVDYGMGNLASVASACAQANMRVIFATCYRDIEIADAVILPGVGAFGDAMACLEDLDLLEVLKDLANAGKPLVGICLGLQLLLTESSEFGTHKGLGIISGQVR